MEQRGCFWPCFGRVCCDRGLWHQDSSPRIGWTLSLLTPAPLPEPIGTLCSHGRPGALAQVTPKLSPF